MEDILLVHRKSNKNFHPLIESDFPIWKTCLRKIIFCTAENLNSFKMFLDPEDEVLDAERSLKLLLEILCGLHSPILGETEVFGQFKNFIESRKQLGDQIFCGHPRWLNFLMTEVKQTRSLHLTGSGSQSYGSWLRRHIKIYNSVTILGSGQLAQEILPWLDEKQVQILSRRPDPLPEFAINKNIEFHLYKDVSQIRPALVIAAPISDDEIQKIMSLSDVQVVFDFRGEENQLKKIIRSQFHKTTIMDLKDFFSELNKNKKMQTKKIQELKQILATKAEAFMQRFELHPLGWDDICA